MRAFPLLMTALIFAAGAVDADAKKKRRRRRSKSGVTTSADGVKRGCENTGQSTRRCYVSGESAELHIRISEDHPVIVHLDEMPSFAVKDKYIAHQVTDKFVIFRLRRKPPKGHNLVLRTENMTLTLYFRASGRGGDSQVQIIRSDRADVNRLVEEGVNKRIGEMKAEHDQKLAALDDRVKVLARKEVLSQLYQNGAAIEAPGGEVRSRNDFLVLRAKESIRIGNDWYLRITVEERKGEKFSIGDVVAAVSQKGAKRRAEVDFRCKHMVVLPGKTVGCTLSLGAIDMKAGRPHLRVTVQGAEGRTVELGDVTL